MKIKEINKDNYDYKSIEIDDYVLVELKNEYTKNERTHKIIRFREKEGSIDISIPIKVYIDLLYEIKEDL